MNITSAGRLLASILICQMAGVIGSVFTYTAITSWYAALQKPWFTPPGWVFAPVWITLYALMGIALYFIWEKGLEKNKAATAIFGVQLGLNALWSIIFFGMQSPFYGFMCIIALWIAIVLTIKKSYEVSRKAGLLLLPYIAWVTIAAALNYYVWILN